MYSSVDYNPIHDGVPNTINSSMIWLFYYIDVNELG